jgi:hypothetical protein
MSQVAESLDELCARLGDLGWVRDVLVGGSLATGDHRVGVSDVDLVALVEGPMDSERVAGVRSLHTALDHGTARGLDLGCVYVDERTLADVEARHPTWTHGVLVERHLSPLARVELVRHGRALRGHGLSGRSPAAVLPPADDDAVRAAVRAELEGYWTWAVRRPWMWLDQGIADLGLVTMARARHALAHGELATKTAVLHDLAVPPRLARQVRARRTGDAPRSPLLLRPWAAAYAWRDARRTISAARPRP